MTIKKYLALLFAQLFVLTAAAVDKVYISDFSIKAGETKMIAINFDSERSDLKRLEGTITMPAGLTVMNQGSSTSALWMTSDAARTNGALAQYNVSTGQVALVGFGSTFNAGTGAIAYIKVTATADLADVSTITLSNFKATTNNNAAVSLTSDNCTVTREAGQGGGGTDPTPVTSDLAFAFSPATLTMSAGEVKQVEVQMTNGMSVTGLQANLVASTGLTIQSVTKGSRMTGWSYNATNGRIFCLGAISGNEGTIFTITLKAADDFSGAATLKASNLAVTDASATSYQAADITLPVTVQSQANVALAFGSEKVSLNPGESTTVDVTLDSEVDLSGFMGTLTLPAGITATLSKGAIVNSAPNYSTTTGTVTYLGGITARQGVLFTLTLTAGTDFTAAGDVTFTHISTTTPGALSIVPADITLPVELKTTASVTAPVAKENLTYSGEAQELVTAGSAVGGTIQYSADGTNYSTSIPTGLDAGTYTVYYKVVGDQNHNDVDPASLTVTIGKAQLTIATLSESTLTYNGTEQTVSVTSVKAGELDVPADDYTVTGDKATDVGDYTATVTAKAESTNFTGSATAQWSITAEDASTFNVTLSEETFVYDGTAKQPVVTVKDGETVLTEGTHYAVAYENNVNAGTAKVTVTGQGNYSGTKEATFTITKATLSDMTLDPATLTYNGTEQTVSVTNVKAGGLDVPSSDYSVSGNTATNADTYTVTVTATGNNYQGTLNKQFTINAASTNALELTLGTNTYTYDGTEKQPTVTVKDGEKVLTAGTDYTVAYENNVNAGTATVTITAQGNYSGTKTANFTIGKAQLTALTLSETSLTYTGEAQTVGVSSVKAGDVDVPADSYEVSGNTQTVANTYTVTATAKEGSNFEGSATAQFTIGKTDATVTAPTAKEGLVYNGSAQTLVNDGTAQGGTLLYSLDGENYGETAPAGTDAKTYTVYYKVTGDQNHNDVAAASLTVTIGKAALTTVTLGETSLTYNGTEQTVGITSVKAGTLDVTEADYTVEGNKGTNVNNYTVTVTATAESNFTGSTSAQWSITAEDASTFSLTLDPTSFTYDGTAKQPAVTVKDGETVLTENTDYTLSYENNVNAGTAKVIATGKGNYSGTKETTFTIAKADVSVTAPTAKTGLVFNGTAQALAEAGTAVGGQMLYSTDGTNYSETVPAKTDAGNYTVYYKVAGDQNHSDVAAQTLTVAIAKAALTNVTLDKTSVVYNKAEQTVSVVSVKAGELTVAAADYTVNGLAGTQANTYTVTVTAKAESNYEGQATAQWTITAATANTAFAVTLDPETCVYDGTEKQPAVTVTDGAAVLTAGTDYTVEYADNVSVGTATVTVTGQGNYSGTKTATFTITAAPAVVSTAPEAVADLYYNGGAQALVSAGEATGGQMQYSLDGTTWQTTLPTAINAGAYTVYYKVAGDANHSDSEPAFVSVPIYKAALTALTLAQTTLTYNGSEQSVAVSSVKAGTLDVTATDYTVTGNKGTQVGDYTVTVVANENSNFTGQVSAQFAIVAAGAEAKFDIELEYTTVEYDGTEKRPAVTVKDGEIVLTEGTDYTVEYTDNVEKGTATVTVTGKGNYSGSKTATFTITRTSFAIEAENALSGEDVPGVKVDVTILDETDKTLRIDNLDVPAAAAGSDLAIYIPSSLGGYEVTEIAGGAMTGGHVTDIYLPDTEQPLTIGAGALPETAIIHTSLALLDDYALMTTLQQNYEAAKVMTTVTPVNKFWTLGTGCDVILPDALSAYTVEAKSETQVSMIKISEDDLTIGTERVLKGNNGFLLLGEAGVSYDLVAYSGRISSGTAIATSDNKDYGTANALEPVVEKMHYDAEGSYFVMKNNEFHAIKAEDGNVKVPAGKAVLHLNSMQAGARAMVLEVVDVETSIHAVDSVQSANDECYDLQGRRVGKAVNGLYIINGKKVVVR